MADWTRAVDHRAEESDGGKRRFAAQGKTLTHLGLPGLRGGLHGLTGRS